MLQIKTHEDVHCARLDVIKSGKTLNTVYSYLVDGMVIDTGPQSLEEDIISFYEHDPIDFAVLTHSHEDHNGTAPWIEHHLGVPIYIHPLGIDVCAQDVPYPQYRQLIWGKRAAFQALPLGDTIQSRNHDWNVIHTPGHEIDHICFLDSSTGRLFSGDLFVRTKTKVIMESESIPVIMDSIRNVLTYDFGSMFCGHAGYIKDGKQKMKDKLEHLEEIYEKVAHLHKEGLTEKEIHQTLFPKTYPITKISGGQWDSLHIVTSIVSDLT